MSDVIDSGFSQPRERPGGRSERVRRDVLAATLNLMLEHGYAQLTIPDVARAAGVHPTTIYRRWSSKGMLALDAIAGVSNEVAPAPDTGSLHGDLTALVNSVAGALRAQPVRELARSLVGLSEPGAAEARRIYWRRRFDIVEKIVQQAVDRGELVDPPDSWEIVEVATGSIWMRALITDLPFDQEYTDRQIERAVDFAMRMPPGKDKRN